MVLRDMIIMKTGSQINEVNDPEVERLFLKWSEEFTAYDPECLKTFEELKHHITWPI